MGIIISDYTGKTAGTYTDTITFRAGVQDAETGINLATITDDYEAQGGDILTGTLSGAYKITVADGATITLKGADITSIPNSDSYSWAGITPLGDATIILEGTNAVKGGYEDYPGIFAAVNSTLTIKGDGSLNVSSNGFAAGIGGGNQIACGNIVIEGGTITATGGYWAAGIGGGSDASCGTITITSGVTSVTATKGTNTPNSIGAGDGGTCAGVIIGGESVGNITESPYTYKPGN